MGGHTLKEFENRVPRRIFGPGRDEVTVGFRKQHIEVPHNLYPLQIVIRMINSSRVRWAEHVARVGGGEECI
jgi:hypothetical protein